MSRFKVKVSTSVVLSRFIVVEASDYEEATEKAIVEAEGRILLLDIGEWQVVKFLKSFAGLSCKVPEKKVVEEVECIGANSAV